MTFVFDPNLLMLDFEELCTYSATTWQHQEDGEGEGGTSGINQSAALTAEGDALLLRKRNKSALSHYTKALEIDAQNANSLIGRSRCYLRLGNTTDALKDADAALERDPSFYKAIYQKAEALYAAGDFEHALIHYCRGAQVRKDKDCFRLGIQKAREAISNAVGSTKATLNVPSRPKSRTSRTPSPASSTKTSSDTRNSRPTSRYSSGPGGRDPRPASSGILGRLYKDTEYLENLLSHPSIRGSSPELRSKGSDIDPDHRKAVGVHVKETLVFLTERREFWMQQEPSLMIQSNKVVHGCSKIIQQAGANGEEE